MSCLPEQQSSTLRRKGRKLWYVCEHLDPERQALSPGLLSRFAHDQGWSSYASVLIYSPDPSIRNSVVSETYDRYVTPEDLDDLLLPEGSPPNVNDETLPARALVIDLRGMQGPTRRELLDSRQWRLLHLSARQSGIELVVLRPDLEFGSLGLSRIVRTQIDVIFVSGRYTKGNQPLVLETLQSIFQLDARMMEDELGMAEAFGAWLVFDSTVRSNRLRDKIWRWLPSPSEESAASAAKEQVVLPSKLRGTHYSYPELRQLYGSQQLSELATVLSRGFQQFVSISGFQPEAERAEFCDAMIRARWNLVKLGSASSDWLVAFQR